MSRLFKSFAWTVDVSFKNSEDEEDTVHFVVVADNLTEAMDVAITMADEQKYLSSQIISVTKKTGIHGFKKL